MVYYFIQGLSVAAPILDGPVRAVVLAGAVHFDTLNLYLGFKYPQYAYRLNYEERCSDTISSFVIVAVFIIAVIIIMTVEYQREHDKVVKNAERLNQEAITDSLTKLYNQRCLIEMTDHIVKPGYTGSMQYSMILLDIDDFKRVNDTYGHLRGNQVLSRFSQILIQKAGKKYTAGRYGGEGFILLMPGCGREEAIRFAGMIRLADQNLYKAKAGGKNRIVG